MRGAASARRMFYFSGLLRVIVAASIISRAQSKGARCAKRQCKAESGVFRETSHENFALFTLLLFQAY
jgi:hypothetical protein